MSAIATLSLTDLATVSGGQSAPSFDQYTASQRAKVADPYRQVVCTTAGIKGAPDLAKGVYAGNATDADRIRASEMLQKYCQGGAHLPAQAPASPF